MKVNITYPCTHHLQAFANNVILIRITTNSHSGNSFMHGLSQTRLLFQTFPNFQVNISIVLRPVNRLHINLQVVNFQRWEHTFGSSKEPEPVPSASGMSETAADPQPPVADGASALPPLLPLSPPVSDFSCLFSLCQPLYASCCTVLLYFPRYSTAWLKMFSFLLRLVF